MARAYLWPSSLERDIERSRQVRQEGHRRGANTTTATVAAPWGLPSSPATIVATPTEVGPPPQEVATMPRLSIARRTRSLALAAGVIAAAGILSAAPAYATAQTGSAAGVTFDLGPSPTGQPASCPFTRRSG